MATNTCSDLSDAIATIHCLEDAFLPEDEGGSQAKVLLLLPKLPELVCRYPRDSRVCLQRLISFADTHGPEFFDTETFDNFLRLIRSLIQCLFEYLDKQDDGVLESEKCQFEPVGCLAEIFQSSIKSQSWQFLADSILFELNSRFSDRIKNAFVFELLPIQGRQKSPNFQTVLVDHFRGRFA